MLSANQYNTLLNKFIQTDTEPYETYVLNEAQQFRKPCKFKRKCKML